MAGEGGGELEVTGAVLLNGRYQLCAKLGHGSFGDIYKAVDIETRAEVGVKFEHVRSRRPQLRHEFEVMRLLLGHSLLSQALCGGGVQQAEHTHTSKQRAFRGACGAAQRATTTRW